MKVIDQGQARASKTAVTMSPMGGLNTLDPLHAMDARYATVLTNFIASPQGLQVREGYRLHATNMAGYTQSFLVYNAKTSSNSKMFACAGSRIYDVTSSTIAPTAVQTGLASALWEYTNISTSGGQFLVACNGVDAARFYNGTTWTNFTTVTTATNPGEITSASMSNVNDWKQVIVHQRRLWVTHPNSFKVHYFDIDQIGGVAKLFDFSPVFSQGGSIATIASVSGDMGDGPASFLLVTATTGETAMYQGTDPSQVDAWSLVGTYSLAPPTGVRSTFKMGGDLLMLCEDGLNAFSTAARNQRVDNAAEISLKIQPTLASVVKNFRTLPGFQIINYPGKNLVILNIPQVDADQSFQFVYHTITKGWSQFVGWPAQCWAYFNGNMYFGGNGFVARAFVDYSDNVAVNGTGGDFYIAFAQCAYDGFETPAKLKHFKGVRLKLSTAQAAPRVLATVNNDYISQQPVATISVTPNAGNVWDSAKYDISTWGYGGQNYAAWQTVYGMGYTAGLCVAITVNDYTIWPDTDWIYEEGGVLG